MVPNINIFSLKLTLQKLPTYDNLIKMGFREPNICLFCMRDEETCNHIFLQLQFYQTGLEVPGIARQYYLVPY